MFEAQGKDAYKDSLLILAEDLLKIGANSVSVNVQGEFAAACTTCSNLMFTSPKPGAIVVLWRNSYTFVWIDT